MNQKQPVSYLLQFVFLLGLMGVMMLLSAFLIPLIGSQLMHVPYLKVLPLLNQPEYANLSRLLNTIGAFLIFFVPSLVLAKVINPKPFTQLGFQRNASMQQVMLVLIITFVSIIFGSTLGQLNEWIPLPASLHAKAKELEETYKASMMSMANMKNGTEYMLTVLVLAAAPALFEEVLFRGGFQQVFVGMTGSKWSGIIITSIVFSMVHFSYFGFLPRFALGIVLGLIFYHSQNLWLSVLLHFCNNALVVTQLYITTQQGKPIEKAMNETLPVSWGIGALVLLVLLIRSFRKESERVRAAADRPMPV